MVRPVEYAAARYLLGLEDGESLRAFGESLLANDDYADAAVKLAIVDDLAMSEVGPVFERFCRDLEQPIPSLDEAICIVAAAILRDIADGSDAQAGLQRLMDDVYWRHRSAMDAGHGCYVGEPYGLQDLIGAYWSYDELQKRPDELSIDGKSGSEAITLLDQRVREMARAWLSKHAPII